MSKTIKIKKGLDIKLKGKAELATGQTVQSVRCAINPSDFYGIIPKLAVKTDDLVKAGTALLYDKNHPEIKITSPLSGKVVEINRGERRRILEIVIEADGQNQAESFLEGKGEVKSDAEARELLLQSGLWPFILQRPFGTVAKPTDKPRDIFISGFDSAPLAPDLDHIISAEKDAFQKGINLLAKLTSGEVYLGVRPDSKLSDVKGANVNTFSGPHPAGNVGVQIHHIKPINKGEIVWTINPIAVVFIGRLLATGTPDFTKTIALTGSEVKNPTYVKALAGIQISSIVNGKTKKETSERIISGNILTGTKVDADDYLGFYHNHITVIPEGNTIEPLGWATPGFKKFSATSTFLSKLFPSKEYVLDANLHGGERAFVVTGQYEKVLPMDIYPVFLLKAILANDFDKMEQLGIYEVVEEDFALCEYVCTSKIEVQSILRKGLDTVIKETA